MACIKLDQFQLTEFAAEVMVYFEKHKLIDIVVRLIAECVLERPEDVQKWIAENLIRIADEIYSCCLDNSHKGGGEVNYYQLPGRFLHRIVIFGRRGSGRKTQAIALVKRFNLVLIDAEQIIYQCLRASEDKLSQKLQNAFKREDASAKSEALGKIIARRLLQMDALRQGWVLVNYPNTLQEFQLLMEKFKTPPNRVVFLQCSELVAMRRLLERPCLGCPQAICDYIEQEMRFYKETEPEIVEYLNRRHETVFVDSSNCFEAVKTSLWASLEHSSYVMGFKN